MANETDTALGVGLTHPVDLRTLLFPVDEFSQPCRVVLQDERIDIDAAATAKYPHWTTSVAWNMLDSVRVEARADGACVTLERDGAPIPLRILFPGTAVDAVEAAIERFRPRIGSARWRVDQFDGRSRRSKISVTMPTRGWDGLPQDGPIRIGGINLPRGRRLPAGTIQTWWVTDAPVPDAVTKLRLLRERSGEYDGVAVLIDLDETSHYLMQAPQAS